MSLLDIKQRYSTELKSLLIVKDCEELKSKNSFLSKKGMLRTYIDKDKARKLYTEVNKTIDILIVKANTLGTRIQQDFKNEINKLITVQKLLCDCILPGECDIEDLRRNSTKIEYDIPPSSIPKKELRPSSEMINEADNLFNTLNSIVNNYKSKSLAEIEGIQSVLLDKMKEKQTFIINPPTSKSNTSMVSRMVGKTVVPEVKNEGEKQKILDEMKVYSVASQLTAVAGNEMNVKGGKNKTKYRKNKTKYSKKTYTKRH